MSAIHSEDITRARVELLDELKHRNYQFITPTPATHARVLSRSGKSTAQNLRDVFGWSLPFEAGLLDEDLLNAMRTGDLLERRGDLLTSRVRVSTLGAHAFLHSAYPTTQRDAVFFGPDSYRFAAFLQAELPRLAPIKHMIDIGAGTGVGGVVALRPGRVKNLTATEINPAARELLNANFDFVMMSRQKDDKFSLRDVQCDGIDGVDGPVDCIIANPPYIIDAAHRAYRDGGGMHGAEISLTWAKAAAERLTRGGAFLLYTGSAIVNGEDRLKAALHDVLAGFDVRYREIDPDVFGEELEREEYSEVERIAVVGAVAVKR